MLTPSVRGSRSSRSRSAAPAKSGPVWLDDGEDDDLELIDDSCEERLVAD